MTKVYIVEEYTWDHHENIAVFKDKDSAVTFCTKEYGIPEADGHWVTYSYNYMINEYEVI